MVMTLNFREILAKKRQLAIILLVYTAILLVVLSAFLSRYNVGNQLYKVWQRYPSVSIPDQGNVSLRLILHHLHRSGTITVAIGGGITSKGTNGLSEANIATTMTLFTVFIPSFCQTASPGFQYSFYFAYDQEDPLFSKQDFLNAFKTKFVESVQESCLWNLNVTIHTVQCSHSGKPTWAQNDAMLEAYLDNVEYFYRINDDTKMITKNWTEMFITVLMSYVPINVGVVGPKHYGGNVEILTYDFVHRTHVDVFGFYYPRLFTDWWGDDWITRVYEPHRSTKHQGVFLEHTMGTERRYNVNNEVEKKLKEQIETDKKTLQR